MATEPLYIQRNPGDLIAAEDWNNLQSRIREDIDKQIKAAIKNLTTVSNSENTHKIDNQTSDDLTKAILEKVRHELPLRTGYLRKFKMLTKTEITIEHMLGAYPEVDIYELVKFDAICSEDDIKSKTGVLFYLYQEEETKITTMVRDGALETKASAVIEARDERPFRVPFHEMLTFYNVDADPDFTLDTVETAFWTEFMKQNDDFEDDLRCHSPWFDRCCGEERTIRDLQRSGAWKRLWFKVVPRKTINTMASPPLSEAPTQVEVRQCDLNTIAVRLLDSGATAERPALIIMKV